MQPDAITVMSMDVAIVLRGVIGGNCGRFIERDVDSVLRENTHRGLWSAASHTDEPAGLVVTRVGRWLLVIVLLIELR